MNVLRTTLFIAIAYLGIGCTDPEVPVTFDETPYPLRFEDLPEPILPTDYPL
jgi:hypothetical protein